jgi:hypothetical protein
LKSFWLAADGSNGLKDVLIQKGASYVAAGAIGLPLGRQE